MHESELYLAFAFMTNAPTRQTVLLAEDHADTRAMYAEMFRSMSFEVLEADRGDRALELARQRTPSIVVTDLILPGLTGLELATALKGDAATRGIPILCLSGYADGETSAAAAASGIDRLIVKPCLPDELVALARELMDS